MNIGDLKQRQGLPLKVKILKSIRTIENYYEQNEGDVYIAKGGVDSTIVEWLANQSIYAGKIESVCVASVEPTENIRHNFESGNTLLKSVIPKKEVINEWGYPLISKVVAMAISRYCRTKHDWVKDRRLNGYIGRNGIKITDGVIPKKYQGFIYAPFELSEKCCDKTKKKPMKLYEKHTGKKPITGEMASESRSREKEYLKHGCIMHDKKSPKCTPIGFWTDQDIKRAIYEYKIPISKAYGEVIKNKDGTFSFTGENRTGCDICAFGIMKDPERFERLKDKKFGLYNQMMNGGHWIRKDRYRWVKFRPTSMPIYSNLYWVPNDLGYGYKFVLNYMYELLNIDRDVS